MIMLGKRPRSLCEVVRRAKSGEQKFDTALLEFLDSYYANPEQKEDAIKDAPATIDALHDAYVSAVAEHLARSFGLTIPEWTERQGHDLREPFFAGGLQSLKGVLVAESPAAFRRRMLFVSQDALSRPRLPQPEGDRVT